MKILLPLNSRVYNKFTYTYKKKNNNKASHIVKLYARLHAKMRCREATDCYGNSEAKLKYKINMERGLDHIKITETWRNHRRR